VAVPMFTQLLLVPLSFLLRIYAQPVPPLRSSRRPHLAGGGIVAPLARTCSGLLAVGHLGWTHLIFVVLVRRAAHRLIVISGHSVLRIGGKKARKKETGHSPCPNERPGPIFRPSCGPISSTSPNVRTSRASLHGEREVCSPAR